MTLQELYKAEKKKPKLRPASPSELFVRDVMDVTKKSESAVRSWLGGKMRPGMLEQCVLAAHFGIDREELFPNIKKDKS